DLSNAQNITDVLFFALQKGAKKTVFPNVKSLTIVGAAISDVSVIIAGELFGKLKELTIDACPNVTEYSLNVVGKGEWKNLTKLSAQGCSVRLPPTSFTKKIHRFDGCPFKMLKQSDFKATDAVKALFLRVPAMDSKTPSMIGQTASKESTSWTGILRIETSVSKGDKAVNLIECDVSLSHMFSTCRTVHVLSPMNVGDLSFHRLTAAALVKQFSTTIVTTTIGSAKNITDLSTAANSFADARWKDSDHWTIAEQKAGESALRCQFWMKQGLRVEEVKLESLLPTIRSSKFIAQLNEDSAVSELPSDYFTARDLLSKGTKFDVGDPNNSILFSLSITGYIAFVPESEWYFKDMKVCQSLFNNLHAITNGTKEKRKKIPWLEESANTFAIADLRALVRQECLASDGDTTKLDVEQQYDFVDALCRSKLFLCVRRPWVNEPFLEPAGVFFSALPKESLLPLESLWPDARRSEEQELDVTYDLPMFPFVPSFQAIMQDICDISQPKLVWQSGMLASHFCCDLLVELKQQTGAELQGSFQLFASVRTLQLGADKKLEKSWRNGQKQLRRALTETYKLLRQIIESNFIKYGVPFKAMIRCPDCRIIDQTHFFDPSKVLDGSESLKCKTSKKVFDMNNMGIDGYFPLTCKHERRSVGRKRFELYTNGGGLGVIGRCSLCRMAPTGQDQEFTFCDVCALCPRCTQFFDNSNWLLNNRADFTQVIITSKWHAAVEINFDFPKMKTLQVQHISGRGSIYLRFPDYTMNLQRKNLEADEEVLTLPAIEFLLEDITSSIATQYVVIECEDGIAREGAWPHVNRNRIRFSGSRVAVVISSKDTKIALSSDVPMLTRVSYAEVNTFLECELPDSDQCCAAQVESLDEKSVRVACIDLNEAGEETTSLGTHEFQWTDPRLHPIGWQAERHDALGYCGPYMWKAGMKLEAVNQSNPHLTCVASILQVSGNKVTITFDGWGNNYNYTTETSSSDLHPIGYCQFSEADRTLQPPYGYVKEFEWAVYLKETISVPVPYDLFNEDQRGKTPRYSQHVFSFELQEDKDNEISLAELPMILVTNKLGENEILDPNQVFAVPLPSTLTKTKFVTCDRYWIQSIQTENYVTFLWKYQTQQTSIAEIPKSVAIESVRIMTKKGFPLPRNNIDTVSDHTVAEKKDWTPMRQDSALRQLFSANCATGFLTAIENGVYGTPTDDSYTDSERLQALECLNLYSKTVFYTSAVLLYDEFILNSIKEAGLQFAKTEGYQLYTTYKEQSAVASRSKSRKKTKQPFRDEIKVSIAKGESLQRIPYGFHPELRAIDTAFITLKPLEGNQQVVTSPENLDYIQNLLFLDTIQLGPINTVTTFPSYGLWTATLVNVYCSDLPLLTFPDVLCECANLRTLAIVNCGIQQIPESIGKLRKLEWLFIGRNRINQLPQSLASTDIDTLDLTAVNWISPKIIMHADVVEYVREKYHPLTSENSSSEEGNIQKSVVEDMKRRGDGAYQSLTTEPIEEENIAKLNDYLSDIFNRLTVIPIVVYQLKYLRELNLTNQNIQAIPASIGLLVNLEQLNLSMCLRLQTISEEAGRCPLKTLQLAGCVSLNTPPQEVVKRGSDNAISYLRRLLRGFQECKRTKLMMVGLGGAGKTSLVRALLSNHYQSEGTTSEEITNGIDIAEWNVRVKSGETYETINYSIWDFAGQAVYYNTHQFFMSNRAVYFLVWNTRLGHEHAGLEFWLSSIACHAPLAPIFVVGTHADQVIHTDIPELELTETFPQIVSFNHISVLTGQGVSELAEKLFEVTLQQSYMGEKVPTDWLNLEEALLEKRDSKVIDYQEAWNLAKELGMIDEADVKEGLALLHELGSVQYFSNELLRNKVITNPQWLVDVMACLITVKESVIKDGRFKREDIAVIWAKYPVSLHPWLLQLTEEFDLTYTFPSENVNIVPCLLPEQEPEYEWPEIIDENIKEMKLAYAFKYLPAGLFNRAQSRLCQYSDSSAVWKKGSLLKKNQHLALLRQVKDQQLVLIVQGPRPENVLFLVHEVLETLIDEFFKGVTYDLSIPCTDCVRNGSQDAHMFSAKNIQRATELKTPILQCIKSFHIVSISALTELMPPSSIGEYERHLTGMMHELKQLQSNVSGGPVVILSCAQDASSNGKNIISAEKLRADLSAHHIDAVSIDMSGKDGQKELGSKLTTCLAIVTIISERFCADKSCADAFSFIRINTLRPQICVVISSTDKWSQTTIGGVVATEMYVNMADVDQYALKLDELMRRIQSKAALGSQRAEIADYAVFISYCWVNSKDAVDKGTRKVAGALGEVDPRELDEFLREKGVETWLDIKYDREGALFEEIAEALRKAKLVIVCVSDEYIKSSNCMLEFRFAAGILKLPLLLCPVGTGREWQESEVTMLAFKAQRIDMQIKVDQNFDALLAFVNEATKQKSELADYAVFISYCWVNSKDAVDKGTRKVAGALGEVDPRELDEFLREKGVETWLDIKYDREGALYKEIAEALRKVKLVIVCVSDEYIKSSYCMLEFHIATETLKLPLLLCPVGTGREWQKSEVAMLALNAQCIDMQIKVDQNFDALLAFVNEATGEKSHKRSVVRKAVSSVVKKKTRKNKEEQISEKVPDELWSSESASSSSAARRRRSDRSRSKPKQSNSNVEEQKTVKTDDHSAYEEVCELAQRKFLRQCMQTSVEIALQPTFEWFTMYPNLMFLDRIIDDTNELTKRPPTALQSNNDRKEVDTQSADAITAISLWELIGLSSKNACLRFLCENDGAWHATGSICPLDSIDLNTFLPKIAAYLAPLYSILQYAPITVNILECGENTEQFLHILKQAALTEGSDFKQAMIAMKQFANPMVGGNSLLNYNHELIRCFTHSRKKLWLCEQHRQNVRGIVEDNGIDFTQVNLSLVSEAPVKPKMVLPSETGLKKQLKQMKRDRSKPRVKKANTGPPPVEATSVDSSASTWIRRTDVLDSQACSIS
uniref:non-specific serine/threonine protein kinase n=1 Tax=Plectus sambesii TaxID=2011161 RepID=A0A914X924_9BILA